jgi:phage tail sheath protein FI
MPVTPTFPGVYIEEIPSGVHTITGVATSIAAFVDTFPRGPVNYAVQLLSLTDFENYMGGLDTTSEASYAIQQFFLNGGAECYAVRVTGSQAGAKAAKAAFLNVPDSVPTTVFTATAGQMIGTRKLDNMGQWGNHLRMDVDYDTLNPLSPEKSAAAGSLFNVTVSEVDTSGNVLRSEVFRNLNTTAGDPAYVVDAMNNGSKIVYVGPATLTNTNRPEATGTTSGGLPLVFASPPDKSTCTITPTGGSGKTCTLELNGATPPDYPSLRPYLEAAIRAADTSNPLLSGVTVQVLGIGSTANPYFYRILAGRGGTGFDPTVKLEFSDANSGADVLASDLKLNAKAISTPTTTNVQQHKFGSGQDDTLVNDVTLRGLEANKTGFYALDDVDLFNVLCIPAATTGSRLGLSPTQVQAIINEATVYCDDHRAMFIVDIPASVNDLPGMQVWMTTNASLRNINSAVYFPRVRIPDPLNGSRLRDVGPSGTLAGLWAATDVSRGVWKAPAGVDVKLINVPQLVYNLVDRENGVLNPLGINCLRNFPVYGNISWGARTLFGADVQTSEWKYIPVRRLALFLEESLFRGTKWVVFEPNDEPLWAQIRMNVTSFMHDLFRQGAFQGLTPSQAYLVKCDSEINTQSEIDKGIVNILVGFAPLKPAEFVILQIQQLAGQTPA